MDVNGCQQFIIIQYTVALETSTCCQLKVFLPLKRKHLLQYTVDYEVSTLLWLTFNDNLITRQENSVLCLHQVSVLTSLKTVHNSKVSILNRSHKSVLVMVTGLSGVNSDCDHTSDYNKIAGVRFV